jgi:uncharacterized membrane protein
MFKKYFITGLASLIPAALLVWVATLVYDVVVAIAGAATWQTLLAGFGIAVGSVLLLGALLVHSSLVRGIKRWIELQIIKRTPLAKQVYGFAQDVVELVGAQRTYDKIVAVQPFGKTGARMIGFLTNEEEKVVFIPSSPNPLSGQVYAGLNYEVLTDWTYEDVVKYNASVGLVRK